MNKYNSEKIYSKIKNEINLFSNKKYFNIFEYYIYNDFELKQLEKSKKNKKQSLYVLINENSNKNKNIKIDWKFFYSNFSKNDLNFIINRYIQLKSKKIIMQIINFCKNNNYNYECIKNIYIYLCKKDFYNFSYKELETIEKSLKIIFEDEIKTKKYVKSNITEKFISHFNKKELSNQYDINEDNKFTQMYLTNIKYKLKLKFYNKKIHLPKINNKRNNSLNVSSFNHKRKDDNNSNSNNNIFNKEKKQISLKKIYDYKNKFSIDEKNSKDKKNSIKDNYMLNIKPIKILSFKNSFNVKEKKNNKSLILLKKNNSSLNFNFPYKLKIKNQ